MYSLEMVKKGISDFLSKDIRPLITQKISLEAVIYDAGLLLLSKSTDKLIDGIIDNPVLKALGIVTDEGIDVDAACEALVESAGTEKIKIHKSLPLLLSADDFELLKKRIKEAE